jgi:hypothetical protein
MPTSPAAPPPTPPAGRGQRRRRDRYGRPMSKWSAATGRIRRHATGILGGRLGGVPAAAEPTLPPDPAPVPVPSSAARSTEPPAAPQAVPTVPAGATGLRPPAPRMSDDTVRMPRQPAALTEPPARRSSGPVPTALTERTVNLRLPSALRRAAERRPARRVGRFLRAIDRRLLPPVGRALASLGRGALWGRVVATTGAVTCVALTVVAVYTATRPATAAPEPAGVAVGVANGTDIPSYVAQHRAAFDGSTAAPFQPGGPVMRYALVSFRRYLTPLELEPVLTGVESATVFMRAKPAGVIEAAVRTIPTDVTRAMTMHANELAGDIADLRTKIARLGPSAGEIALKKIYQDRVASDEAEKAAYADPSGCMCVFGAVVHGSTAALQTLAAGLSVRAVELVPLAPDVSRDTFMPPVPEQSGVASPPPVESSSPR